MWDIRNPAQLWFIEAANPSGSSSILPLNAGGVAGARPPANGWSPYQGTSEKNYCRQLIRVEGEGRRTRNGSALRPRTT